MDKVKAIPEGKQWLWQCALRLLRENGMHVKAQGNESDLLPRKAPSGIHSTAGMVGTALLTGISYR